MGSRNRIANASNKFQGDAKRVLCVCSAGLLRSPTAAKVLSNPPYNFNTRCAGVNEDFALIPVDDVLVYWSDEIVCMTQEHKLSLDASYNTGHRKVIVLDVPDNFERDDPELIRLIKEKYEKQLNV